MASALGREFDFLHRGAYWSFDVELLVNPKRKTYLKATRELIEAAWEQMQDNPEQKLFNSRVLSYEGWKIFQEILRIKTRVTDYKSFYGTNICNAQALAPDQMANALAVCAVIVSSDEAILMGKRTQQVAESQNQWHVIGGTLQAPWGSSEYRGKLGDYNVVKAHSNNHPSNHVFREIKEELGLDTRYLYTPTCLGIGINLLINKPELILVIEAECTASELRECAMHAIIQGEHSQLTTLCFEDIPSFVQNHPVAPIAKAALFAALAYHEEEENWPTISLQKLAKRYDF